MMLAGRQFHFRPIMTVCVALALGVLIALGAWQMHRLQWKRALIAQVEARIAAPPIAFDAALARAEAGEDMEYTPVTLAGMSEPGARARVFGSYESQPGIYAFVAMGGARHMSVYVNLGFVPQAARGGAPDFDVRPEADITGLFRRAERPTPPASWFQQAHKSADGLWFVRDPVRFAAAAGIEASPYYIDQFAVPGRDGPQGGTTRLEFNNRHLEYALTWYGLGLTLVGVWLAFSLQKP